MISQMVMEFILRNKEAHMKGTFSMGRKMAKGGKNGQMDPSSSEILKMEKLMVMGHINGPKKLNIQVSGKMML